MGIYAGQKGCDVYRDGVLTHVSEGELVPEFLKMSPQGLQSRIRQHIVTVNWDEDDKLLHPPIVPALPVPLVSIPPVSLKPVPPSVPINDWWPLETTRGFTSHLVDPDDEGKFLCGRISQQPDEVPEGIDAKQCGSCVRVSKR